MSETLNRLDGQYRIELLALLGRCTDKQQAFFARMYPMGIEQMTMQKLRRGIEQCEVTLAKAEPPDRQIHD